MFHSVSPAAGAIAVQLTPEEAREYAAGSSPQLLQMLAARAPNDLDAAVELLARVALRREEIPRKQPAPLDWRQLWAARRAEMCAEKRHLARQTGDDAEAAHQTRCLQSLDLLARELRS